MSRSEDETWQRLVCFGANFVGSLQPYFCPFLQCPNMVKWRNGGIIPAFISFKGYIKNYENIN